MRLVGLPAGHIGLIGGLGEEVLEIFAKQRQGPEPEVERPGAGRAVDHGRQLHRGIAGLRGIFLSFSIFFPNVIRKFI